MNKISLYVLLILVYLGISKSFSPSEKKTPFLVNEKVFTNYFKGDPLSIILLDSFSTGLMIKTYHHRYKLVYAFAQPEEIIVRTSRQFWQKNLGNHGNSLFRRNERAGVVSTIPMPPGALYIGDPSYGTWVPTDYGSKIWKFHRAYKNFPQIFGWDEFRPDLDFFQRMKIYQNNEKPYYGPNNEFGTNGLIRRERQNNKEEKKIILPTLKNSIKKYLWFPKWNSKNE